MKVSLSLPHGTTELATDKSTNVHFHLPSMAVAQVVPKIGEVHIPLSRDALPSQFLVPLRHPMLSLVHFKVSRSTIAGDNALCVAIQCTNRMQAQKSTLEDGNKEQDSKDVP